MDAESRFLRVYTWGRYGYIPSVVEQSFGINIIFLLSASSGFDGWAKIPHQYQLMSYFSSTEQLSSQPHCLSCGGCLIFRLLSPASPVFEISLRTSPSPFPPSLPPLLT
jgi:hypothetical protein